MLKIQDDVQDCRQNPLDDFFFSIIIYRIVVILITTIRLILETH